MSTFAATLTANFNGVVKHSEESLEITKNVEAFYRKRAALEVKYAQDLSKLALGFRQGIPSDKQVNVLVQSPEDREFACTGSLLLTWWNALEECLAVATAHEDYGNQLQSTVVDVLHQQSKELEANRKGIIAEAQKCQKDLEAAYTAMKKAKLSYDQARKESEDAASAVEKATYNYQTKDKNIQKLQSRSRKNQEQLQMCQDEYLEKESFSKLTQDEYYNRKLPDLLTRFQELEEKNGRDLRQALIETSDLTLTKMQKVTELTSVLAEVIDSATITADIQEFVTSNMEHGPVEQFSVMSLLDPDMTGRMWMTTKVTGTIRPKQFFFVLMGSEQKLYYFESEDSKCQKGVIPLEPGNRTVRSCDRSLLAHEHSFQIVTSEGTHYFMCDYEDEMSKWMDALQAATQVSITDGTKERHVQSMSLKISECKEMPQAGNYYVMVMFDDEYQAKTQIKNDVVAPTWEDDFYFDQVPPDCQELRLVIFDARKNITGVQRDIEYGLTSVSVNKIVQDGGKLDGWLPILTMEGEDTGRTVRVEATITDEKIRPVHEYFDLANAVWTTDTLEVLNKVMPGQNRVKIARTFLNTYAAWGKEIDFLSDLCAMEIDKTDNPALLFRGNTLATKALDQYMKQVGTKYLHNTLVPAIAEIYNCKGSCEIDVTKVKENELAGNWKRLIGLTEQVWKSIIFSIDKCPYEIRSVLQNLQRSAKEKYSDQANARYIVISGVFFLRFVCPAVLNPKLFNMMNETPGEHTARTLTLVAKTLQNLANLQSFGKKELYMEDMNQFIQHNIDVMKACIDNLCHTHPADKRQYRPRVDLPREMAFMHSCLMDCEAKIAKQHATAPSKDVQELLDCLTDLQKPEDQRRTRNRANCKLPDISWVMQPQDHRPSVTAVRQLAAQRSSSGNGSSLLSRKDKLISLIKSGSMQSTKKQARSSGLRLEISAPVTNMQLSNSSPSPASPTPTSPSVKSPDRRFSLMRTIADSLLPEKDSSPKTTPAVVVYDYTATDEDSIDVTKNMRVEVVELDVAQEPGWSIIRHEKRQGFVPTSYIQLLDTKKEGQPQQDIQRKFYTGLTHEEAAKFLRIASQKDYILWQPAMGSRNSYALSVKFSEESTQHWEISRNDKGFVLDGDAIGFPTLDALVEHYKHVPLVPGNITLGDQL
eukprot:comp20574_c1_seq2/m.26483 comp20574_c1_seq2/g.26483  ORF comp20574_c1_seq2/g.26483 comp20574_c1_seq2/m.26483 type:complete len:1157 (-) comp20574_c1_seq2:544-4014(-)